MRSLVPGIAALASNASALELDVRVYWPQTGASQFELMLGERELCKLSGQSGPEGWEVGHCKFALPSATDALIVRGEYALSEPTEENEPSGFLESMIQRFDKALGVEEDNEVANRPRRLAGETKISLVDGSALTAPWYRPGLSLGERWRQAAAAEAAFAEQWDDVARMGVAAPVTRSRIDSAEATLGFSFPVGFAEFEQDVGAARVGDHAFLDPVQAVTGRETLFEEWGLADQWELSREDIEQAMPEPLLRRLHRSVAVFFEIGDGLGIWLYVAPPEAGCGSAGGWLWLHQDSVVDDLKTLEHGRLECIAFAELLRRIHGDYVFSPLMDELSDRGSLLIDAHAQSLPVSLEYDTGDSDEFRVRFRRR